MVKRSSQPGRLRRRQRIGKYRIEKQVGAGGFATVYRALDTIEGIRVALKIPHPEMVNPTMIEELKKEVRLVAALDHPNILPLKNATFEDGHLLIASPLGEETLGDRLQRRVGAKTALDYTAQMLEALSYAHQEGIIHCDVKPENFILFFDGRLRLADFGIAKLEVQTRTVTAMGTFGYMSPEQALGKPSKASDVFSVSVLIYRLFTGALPDWPYDWPPEGFDRLKRSTSRAFREMLQRGLDVDYRRRFVDCERMLDVFKRIRPRALRTKANGRSRRPSLTEPSWRTVRTKELTKRFRQSLSLGGACPKCRGPVGEAMTSCPWCGRSLERYKGKTAAPARCDRCGRGVKLDWKYCAFCYGPKIGPARNKTYSDRRYAGSCHACHGNLLPFSRYCPWCRRKVRRRWKLEGETHTCRRCRWQYPKGFFDFCPWCGSKALGRQ